MAARAEGRRRRQRWFWSSTLGEGRERKGKEGVVQKRVGGGEGGGKRTRKGRV